MQRVDAVLGAFEKEMKAQGLWDSVSVLTISDFGRTLTSNGRWWFGVLVVVKLNVLMLRLRLPWKLVVLQWGKGSIIRIAV